MDFSKIFRDGGEPKTWQKSYLWSVIKQVVLSRFFSISMIYQLNLITHLITSTARYVITQKLKFWSFVAFEHFETGEDSNRIKATKCKGYIGLQNCLLYDPRLFWNFWRFERMNLSFEHFLNLYTTKIIFRYFPDN